MGDSQYRSIQRIETSLLEASQIPNASVEEEIMKQ